MRRPRNGRTCPSTPAGKERWINAGARDYGARVERMRVHSLDRCASNRCKRDRYDSALTNSSSCPLMGMRRYCGLHNPSSMVKCLSCQKWFCNGYVAVGRRTERRL